MSAVGSAATGPVEDVTVADLLRENLLTVDEVAERAKVSAGTVVGWLHAGLLPSVALPPAAGTQGDARAMARVQGFRRGRQLLRIRETDWVRFVRAYVTTRRAV